MENLRPDSSLPRIWCDFNACGWSGEPDDDCFYALDVAAITTLRLTVGAKVFAWDDDGGGDWIGCEGRLESYRNGWRVRPIAASWSRGRMNETNPD